MAEFEPGTEVAGYRIESVIGRGGMAVVYRAEDTRLGRKVALKLLTPALAENEQFQQRFIRESRLAASLDHPNIVPIYEAGESNGRLFIAMRYVPGSDLKAMLANDGLLPPARMLRVFVQTGDALDAAHLLGLVHRDVKPGNILITSVAELSGHAHRDHVYLTDFGLTKRTSSLTGSLTGTGHFLGTVDYVSPEQIKGAPVGPATDIYALGCVLYECLTGQLPFRRDDDAAVLWAHLVEMPPPITAVRPDLPSAVNDVIARAMAKEPEERYDSCRELVGDLEHALNLQADVAEGHPEPSRQGARQTRPVEDASLTLGESRPLRDVMPPRGSGDASQANEAQGWVSHPSLPPGVMAPGGWPRTREPVDDEEDAFPSLLPDGDDGLDQDPDLDAEAWDPSWDGGSPDQGSPEPARTRGRRWLPLLAAAVVLVLAAIAGFVYYQAHQSEAFRPYTTGTQPPFSLRYPESWKVNVGNAFSDVIISPKPDALGAALLQPGGEWGPTRQLLTESPSEAVGVYLNATASPPVDNTETALKAVILQYLGQHSKLDFLPTHHQFMVAGSAGNEFEGMLSDREAPGTRLKVMIDYVQGPEGSVLLAFFAPPNRFEQLQPVFTEMRDTVRFTG